MADRTLVLKKYRNGKSLNTKRNKSPASYFPIFDTLILNLVLFFSCNVIFYNFEISSAVPGRVLASRPDGLTAKSQAAAVGSLQPARRMLAYDLSRISDYTLRLASRRPEGPETGPVGLYV